MRANTFRITGATVITPGGVEAVDVTIDSGRIAAIGREGTAARDIDGRGLILAPALIDVHGDAFERQVMPRPNVLFPLDAALLETDRQLAANGVATAYHALTLGWEPGLRSVEQGAALVDALEALGPRLTVENRIQLRWEIFAEGAMPLIRRVLAAPLTPAIAFNDHTSMTLRSFDQSVQERGFELSPDFQAADPRDPRMAARIAGSASRAGLSTAAYVDLQASVWARRPQVEANVRAIAAAGRAAGAPMLSHDDSQLETRTFYRGLGAAVSEFPMTLLVTHEARARGDGIVFGAPNALRGGSHIGSPSAADMVEADLCDALASDYYYPAMLAAMGRLHAERRAPLHRLWERVSGGPARIMGLADRGRIEVGARADLVLLDWPDQGTPSVRATWVAGRQAYAAAPAGI